MMNKILVIEDDVSLLKMYHTKLTGEGFVVQGAADGESGLARALEEHPDLILLDINLPKMDGLTVMKKLREDAWGSSVPIIIVSNLEANDERVHAVTKNEPAYYLLKPDYTLDDLLIKIREVLTRVAH